MGEWQHGGSGVAGQGQAFKPAGPKLFRARAGYRYEENGGAEAQSVVVRFEANRTGYDSLEVLSISWPMGDGRRSTNGPGRRFENVSASGLSTWASFATSYSRAYHLASHGARHGRSTTYVAFPRVMVAGGRVRSECLLAYLIMSVSGDEPIHPAVV
jgi:hypothetical protein